MTERRPRRPGPGPGSRAAWGHPPGWALGGGAASRGRGHAGQGATHGHGGSAGGETGQWEGRGTLALQAPAEQRPSPAHSTLRGPHATVTGGAPLGGKTGLGPKVQSRDLNPEPSPFCGRPALVTAGPAPPVLRKGPGRREQLPGRRDQWPPRPPRPVAPIGPDASSSPSQEATQGALRPSQAKPAWGPGPGRPPRPGQTRLPPPTARAGAQQPPVPQRVFGTYEWDLTGNRVFVSRLKLR